MEVEEKTYDPETMLSGLSSWAPELSAMPVAEEPAEWKPSSEGHTHKKTAKSDADTSVALGTLPAVPRSLWPSWVVAG